MTLPGKRLKDRRIQKTQKLLREALFSLIREKNFDSIVVKDILDRANVGRSTFYMHFGVKDALLVSGMPLPRVAAPPPVTWPRQRADADCRAHRRTLLVA